MIPIPFLMFVSLIILLLLGIPVAFAIFFTALIFGLILWGWIGLDVLYKAVWGTVNNWPLVAYPLFIFMSALMGSCGLGEDIFKAVYTLLGRLRGSLFYVAIAMGFIIGAMSGSIMAGLSSLALLIYPLMKKYNYPKNMSAATLITAGLLPQLVPPACHMIVYGVLTNTSIARLFAGGLGMATIMATLFFIYTAIWVRRHKNLVPVFGARTTLHDKLKALGYLVGPVGIIIGVLGSIYSGMATPTEAGAMGAFLTLVYAAIRRRLNRKSLEEAMITTVKSTTIVFIMIASSSAFSAIFNGIGGKTLVTNMLLSLPGGKVSALLFSLAFLFLLGMFIETTAIIVLAAPILHPVMVQLGYDPVWFGVMFCTMLIVAFVTPPVGEGVLYFSALTNGDISVAEGYKAVIPFLVLMFITVTLGILFPQAIIFFAELLT